MSYTPNTWGSGDVITSAKLNNIEQGIVGVETEANDIKSAIKQDYAYTVAIEPGYWAIADGTPSAPVAQSQWCRTNKFVDKDFVFTTTTIPMWLLAFDKVTGQYVGTWNGTQFSTVYTQTNFKNFNIAEFVANYPGYMYALDFHSPAGVDYITPTDVYAQLTVVSALTQTVTQNVNATNTKLMPLFGNSLKLERGYYAVTDGAKTSSTTWCRTATELPSVMTIQMDDAQMRMFLLAYDSGTGEYIGTWNGTTFVKTYDYWAQAKPYFDLAEFAINYPTYNFKIDFYDGSDEDLPVATVLSKCVIMFQSNLMRNKQDKKCNNMIGNTFGYLYPVTLQTGQYLTFSTSDGAVLGGEIQTNIYFYDEHKAYINYYGFPPNMSVRTVGPLTSELAGAKYIALGNNPPRVPIMINAGQTRMSYEEYFLSSTALTEEVVNINKGVDLHDTAKDEVYVLKRHYGVDASSNNTFKALWASDIHAEVVRTDRMVELLNAWGSDYFDIAINTGDTVHILFSDSLTWYNEAVDESNIPILNTIGNHDAWAELGGPLANQVAVYEKFIAPVAEKTTIVQPQNAATLGLNYYYKDVGGVRVIVLDCMYWDSAELTWFTNVLADAKTNSLPVIACSHAPFESEYCQLVDSIWNVGSFARDSTKTSIDAATAVKNFMDAGGTFICWLMGHIHGDELEILPNYGNQVVVCTNSFQDRGTKVIKNTDTNAYNYDCLMFVTVDVERTSVKFYRIGANIDIAGHKRNGLVWNYSTHTLVTEW